MICFLKQWCLSIYLKNSFTWSLDTGVHTLFISHNISSANMLIASKSLLHFASNQYQVLQEKEGQRASQKSCTHERIPASTDMHIHAHIYTCTHKYTQTHTHTHMHTGTEIIGKNDSAIARVAIYHGSLYLIFRLICQVYSLANLNTNVDANEDSLFLHRLCVEA